MKIKFSNDRGKVLMFGGAITIDYKVISSLIEDNVRFFLRLQKEIFSQYFEVIKILKKLQSFCDEVIKTSFNIIETTLPYSIIVHQKHIAFNQRNC